MAKEFARADNKYQNDNDLNNFAIYYYELSDYGKSRTWLHEDLIYSWFKNFKYIVPQGSIMAMLGNPYQIGSLSNCFVVGQPHDSYGGIMHKDEQLAQLMKRRGGVGLDISTLRPRSTSVSNAAKSSTGSVSFMGRFSNTTREVAQDGRRGALMLSIDGRHPDTPEFINSKRDRTKVTGANISVMLHNDFMEAVKNNSEYELKFPVDSDNVVNKINAKTLYDEIVKNAWENAEPGQMFIDQHRAYSPDSVYPKYRGITTNPWSNAA